MLVYIESNFVLEIALQQEEANAALEILALAETSKITLAIPIFALIEPFWSLSFRLKERKELINTLNTQLNQFKRSRLHQNLASTLDPLVNEIDDIGNKENSSLEQIVRRLLLTSKLLETTKLAFEQAINYQNLFKLQDAVIYSTILSDIQQQVQLEPKYFITRDEIFKKPKIKAELKQNNCDHIFKFEHGLERIQNQLKQP